MRCYKSETLDRLPGDLSDQFEVLIDVQDWEIGKLTGRRQQQIRD